MTKEYKIKNRENFDNSAIKLILLLTVAYVISYFGRKSYDSNINEIMRFYGAGKAEVGLVGTFFFIVYAMGQVFHGIMCKHYNPKIVLPLALTIAAVCNVLMGVMPVEGFRFLKYIWLINGFVMASLWSLTIRTLNRNLSKKRVKQSLIAMAFPVSIGTFMIYGASALFSFLENFKLTFYLAGGMLLAIALIIFFKIDEFCYKSSVEKREQDGLETAVSDGKTGEVKVKTKIDPGFYVLFGVLAFFAIVNNFVKDGVSTWTPTILTDKYSLENWFSVLLTILLPLFAVLGANMAITFSSKIKNYVTLCGLFYLCAGAVMILLILCLNLDTYVVTLICFMFVSAIMAGINNVITNIFPMKVKNVDAGFVAGLIDGFCYVGSALSSFGLGAIVEGFNNNWDPVMYIFAGLCLLSVVVCVVFSLTNKMSKKQQNA